MTKKEALQKFEDYVKGYVIEVYGKNDKSAMSKTWNDYTDSLCKNNRITLHQYETWNNPF